MSIGLLLAVSSPAFASSSVHHPTVQTLPQDPMSAFWQANLLRLHPSNDNCSNKEAQYSVTTIGNYEVTNSLWIPFETSAPYNYCGYVFSASMVDVLGPCAPGTITAEIAIRNSGLHGGVDPQPFGPNGDSNLSFSANVSVLAGTLVTGAGVLNVGIQYISYSGSSNSQPRWYDIPSRNG